jgi:hypothetical protein
MSIVSISEMYPFGSIVGKMKTLNDEVASSAVAGRDDGAAFGK